MYKLYFKQALAMLKENKLLSLPNFIATPHLGGNTEESLRKAGTEVVEETLNVLAGKPPAHPVI